MLFPSGVSCQFWVTRIKHCPKHWWDHLSSSVYERRRTCWRLRNEEPERRRERQRQTDRQTETDREKEPESKRDRQREEETEKGRNRESKKA